MNYWNRGLISSTNYYPTGGNFSGICDLRTQLLVSSDLQWSTPVITSGLVYSLDSAYSSSYPGSGTTWTDLQGGGYNATIYGPTWSSAFNGAFTYDGIDDRITFDKAAFALGSTFTIEIWYRFTSTQSVVYTNGGLFTQAANVSWNGVGSYKGLVIGANQIVYENSSGSQVWTNYTSVPSANDWHQLVFTLDSGTGNVVVDGGVTNIYSATNFQTTYTNTNGMYGIGMTDLYNGTYRGEFIGEIAVLKVYNRVLSSAEITTNFNALRGRYGI